MREIEILLENYWISKDRDKDLYYKMTDSIAVFKGFLTEKLGYNCIINPNLIKLEKLPGRAESWMGIQQFDSVIEYAFLCLILMFLEDRGREEQFVLSQITEFIQGNYAGEEKIDWTLYRHRRHLIKVLRFAVDIGIIRVDDGDEQKFVNSMEAEVLYESTGLSRYFVRNFNTSIQNYNSYKDIENEDWTEIGVDRGTIRRHRVYRRLLMSPVVYNEGVQDADYAYIKNYRGMIENDIEKYLEWNLHVHRNGAMVVLDEHKNMKDTFPGLTTISDIVLQVNGIIVNWIKDEKITLANNDTAVISKTLFGDIVFEVREKYSKGWSKEYREMKLDILEVEINGYMSSFNMIEKVNAQEIKIMPLTGKLIGRYPEDFVV